MQYNIKEPIKQVLTLFSYTIQTVSEPNTFWCCIQCEDIDTPQWGEGFKKKNGFKI